MHLLIGLEPATSGTALTIDIRTLRTSFDVIPRDSGCRACGALRQEGRRT
jgi:hypothetical protein